MEIFRRLGVVQAVRNTGLPADYPNDVAFRTTTTGIELSRIPIPCRTDRYTATGGPDTWWPTPEPPHRINQIFLEPVLFAHAKAMPDVRILNRTQLIGFEQHETGVTATAADLDGGEDLTITADYMIGADGAHSMVRRRIGASLTGDAMLEQRQSTYIQGPGTVAGDADQAGLGEYLAQSAAQRQHVRDRRQARPGWSTTTCGQAKRSIALIGSAAFAPSWASAHRFRSRSSPRKTGLLGG